MKKILILLVIVAVVLFLLVPASFPVEFYCYKEGQPRPLFALSVPRWRVLIYRAIGFETYCKAKEECPKLNCSDCDSKIYYKKVYNFGSVCDSNGDCHSDLQGKKIPYCVSTF